MAAPDPYCVNTQDSVKSLHLPATDQRDTTGINTYMLDRRKYYNDEQWLTIIEKFQQTTTLYIGNLSFYTTEEQLYELFSYIGPVKQIVMGLNRINKTPCGFAFVIYYTHNDAIACHRYLHGIMCDERPITVSLDPGFEEGRQYGRSAKTGGQRRDDYRNEFDPGRGGWAVAVSYFGTNTPYDKRVNKPHHKRKGRKSRSNKDYTGQPDEQIKLDDATDDSIKQEGINVETTNNTTVETTE